MLIESKTLFNNKVFELNEKLSYEMVNTDLGSIAIIDNFYQDIDSVLTELDKLPMTLTYPVSENNVNFFDARKVYKETMSGTEIPYILDLPNIIHKIFGHPYGFVNVDKSIIINCFRYSHDMRYNLDEYYYAVHIDPSNLHHGQKGLVAFVLFLNTHYENGEGINFYMPPKNLSLFTPKKDLELNHFVQGKCNRAVLFNSDMYHGQHTPTEQFKNEIRYTQVIFCSLL